LLQLCSSSLLQFVFRTQDHQTGGCLLCLSTQDQDDELQSHSFLLDSSWKLVLCFFACAGCWISAVVGVFFLHSECSCSWRFRTGGSSWECVVVFFSLVPGVLQLWVFLFPILNVFVVGDSELEEAAAVVGVCVFFLHSECSCTGRIIAGRSSWEQYLRSI